MKKRLLTMLGVLMALPAMARDFSYTYEGQTLTYTVIDEDAKTVETNAGSSYYSYPGNSIYGDLILPSEVYDGDTKYTLTGLGDYAFYGCRSLTSVIIPNSVTSIGARAFLGCSGLTSVIIPNSVTSIGVNAFSGCSGLKKSAYPNTLKNPFSKGTFISYNPDGAIIEDGWIYGPEKKEIRFAPYTLEGEYTIAETVESIGPDAFYGCSGLTSVTIGNSVKSIGSSAFSVCSGLTSVTIGNSVETIGSSAFSVCSGLTSVIIPNSVETIGDYAFSGCSGLTSVIIGNSVESIGEYAFQNCSNLTNAEFSSIEHLCTINFRNPESNPLNYAHHLYINGEEVTDVVIPNSVETIGARAFLGCSGLTSVIIPNSVTSIGVNAFTYCSGLTSVIIGNSVTSIGYNAFFGCDGLKKCAYPNTLENPFSKGTCISYNPEGAIIEDGVIYGPEKESILFAPYTLEGEYTIPNSVKTIGNSAFYGCSNLTSVIIPNSVTKIGWNAFRNCSALTSVIIGNSVTSIGSNAFDGCDGLKKSAYPNTLENPFSEGTCIAYDPKGAIIEDGWIYGPEKESILFASLNLEGEYIIPESVTSIGKEAFRGCSSLTSVTIPNSVTSIGESAFSDCSGLTKAEFPSIEHLCSIKFVNYGSNPLAYAHNLYINGQEVNELVIPESVTAIGDYAFSGCSGLTSIEVTALVPPTFSNYSFSGLYDSVIATVPYEAADLYLGSLWTMFKNLRVAGSETNITSASDGTVEYYLVPAAGADDKNLAIVKPGDYSGEITIPERFTYTDSEGNNTRYYVSGIGYQAFKNSSITKVNFNSRIDIKSIGEEAFYGCKNLTEFAIPNTVETIGNSAFYGCTGLTEFEIPNAVETIGSSAFYGCSGLTEVTVPNSVKTIGAAAFYNCSGLTSVTIGNSVTSIGENAFYNCNKLTNAEFSSIEHLCSINFGNSDSNPLKQVQHLYINGEEVTDVVIPESVTSIGDYAFRGCSHLTSVNIPESVTAIGESAFYDCSGLTSVSIPESVTSISNETFRYCSGLTSVNIPNSVKSIGGLAFASCTGLTSVAIPNSVTSIGSYAFWLCNGLTSVAIPNSVTSIGDDAFLRCWRMTSVTIGNSVETIGYSAFEGCSYLTSVTIPNSVKTIGNSAFSGCDNLNTVIFAESMNPIEIGDDAIPSSMQSLYWGRAIEDLNFSVQNLSRLTIGNFTTLIPANSFKGLTKLTTLKLGSSITEIEANAFSGCNGLNEVVLPPLVETIGESAFAGIGSVSSIIMGANVKSIGDKAFDRCSAKNVYITAQTPPEATNTTFSTYTAKLWLQDKGDNSVLDAYYDAFTCWDRFESSAMIAATEIKVDNNIDVVVGKPAEIKATVLPEDAALPQLFWRSSNPEVATVDCNGVVTAISESGECKIIAETLYANGPVAEINVTVKEAEAPKNPAISIEPATVELSVGKTAELTVTKTDIDDDEVVVWTSSDENVATVDAKGKVTAVGAGTATITATCAGVKAEATVKVNDDKSGINDVTAVDEKVTVYNLRGVKVGESTEGLPKGIYIVREGGATRKIAL